jgi:outer membrane biosynthesis protein TonB
MAFRILVPVVALMAFAGAGRASAEPARIVNGGPRAAAQRAEVKRSLAAAARSLAVCWRGQRPGASMPGTVMVDVSVDARGHVTSARQATAGAFAQCAAGVLAVRSLAATGSEYRLRAAFATRDQGGRSIQAALEPHRAELDQCQARAGNPAARGQAVLRFMIHPEGRITEATIQSSELGDARMERCLTSTIQGIRLASGLTSKTVSYSLALRFDGAAGASRAPAGPATGGLRPRKEGPLSGQAITTVMNRRKAEFSSCFTAQARKNRALAGTVVLRFTIGDEGSPRNVKIRDTTLNNARVEDCIVKVGKSLRFPAESGRAPTKVFYPFEFSSR